MKRIAIFIDGTWNTPDAEHGTNVLKLSRCVRHHDDDGVAQIVLYAPGVGSGRGNTQFGRFLDRSLGGALGWGLLEIIEELYRHLVMIFEPGDEIQLFGFSRGAFAARSFAGVLRSCGIPPRHHLHEVRGAIQRYASRDPATHPEHLSSYEFRKRVSPFTATSAKELSWRNKDGPSAAIRLNINYIGVWDTVKALGLPEKLHISDIANAQHHFHDAALSSSVISARHAIAIDEYRWTFPALPWSNIDTLNRARNGAYLQQYFPGNHGSVGGGGDRTGLSSITLHWIAMGAAQAGLALDWDAFDHAAPDFDPCADLTNQFASRAPSGRDLKDGAAGRAGPDYERDLSLCAFDRYIEDDNYRPFPLAELSDELHGMSPDSIDHLRTLMIARDGGMTHKTGQRMRPRQTIKRRWP